MCNLNAIVPEALIPDPVPEYRYLKKNNFYGGFSIVGEQVPLGTGVGFAHRYRKDGSVAFAHYGDGAANQGVNATPIDFGVDLIYFRILIVEVELSAVFV